MDDIDDFLNEVEEQYCKSHTSNQRSKSIPSSSSRSNVLSVSSTYPSTSKNSSKTDHVQKQKGHRKNSHRDEIDDLIDDIDGSHALDLTPLPPSPKTHPKVSPRPNLGGEDSYSRRCYPVYLGGSSCEQGQGSSISPLSCDRLRCTACDFRVVMYDDQRWDKSVDYLFLRNNVPDFNKLSSKLRRTKGSRAYACQCAWRSVAALTEVRADRELKWVCGKH